MPSNTATLCRLKPQKNIYTYRTTLQLMPTEERSWLFIMPSKTATLCTLKPEKNIYTYRTTLQLSIHHVEPNRIMIHEQGTPLNHNSNARCENWKITSLYPTNQHHYTILLASKYQFSLHRSCLTSHLLSQRDILIHAYTLQLQQGLATPPIWNHEQLAPSNYYTFPKSWN
jgi:hypothetical protein